MKANYLVVSPGPHVHSGARTSDFSLNMLLALIPAVIYGIYYYGLGAAGVIGASVSSAMLAEAVTQKIRGKPVTVADGSAAVSGLLLALILPAGTPLYVVVTANLAGIVVGKQFFGGLGSSPLNPALVGWAVIRVTETWAGFLDFDLMLINYDTGFLLQYPPAVLQAKGPGALTLFDYLSLFLGKQSGGIGAAGSLWVLLGGVYLVLRGIVRWEIPAFFLAGLALVSGFFYAADSSAYADPLFHLVTGNTMIGAFFLSTETSSSPVNRWGMIVYGLGCGALTIVLRAWSVYPDGVVFSCLLMALFVPLVDKIKARQVVPEPVPY